MRKNNLRLTEDQENTLKEYLINRYDSLKAINQERIDADNKSWRVYLNEREDRDDPDTIYGQANLPIPLTSLVVDHFVSRVEDDLTGTSPFFKFDPQGSDFERPAEEFDKYFHWKLDTQAGTRRVYEQAYLHMFVQRLTILKSIFEEDKVWWQDFEQKGLYDYELQEFVKIPEVGYVLESEAEFIQQVDPATGQPVLVLQQDPSVVFDPNKHQFTEIPEGVWMEEIRYKGAKAKLVESDRFLKPNGSIEEADALVEMYDKPLRWVRDMWLVRDFATFNDFVESINEDATEKTEEMNRDSGPLQSDKENLQFDRQNTQVPILEFWIKRDVLDIGTPQEFVVFMEAKTQKIIYYEYTAKVTPDNKHPFSVIQINDDKSLVEVINPYQEYIDRQFNSQSYRNELAANPITGLQPQAMEEEPEDLELYPGVVVTLKEQFSLRDAIQHVEVPNNDVQTQSLIDFIFGLVQLWLGVSNLAQGDYQALAPANTATGVEATLRESSKLGRRWMRKIIRGIEDNLFKLVQLTLETLDKPEVFEYMEGEVRAFSVIEPEELHDLDIKVEVILAQEQGQREIEKTDLALKTQERYFQYPPQIRPFARPLLARILENLGYEQTDRLLPEKASEPNVPSTEDENVEGDLPEKPESGNISGSVERSGSSNKGGENQNT